jgi:AcrR family transcriptional regulator
VEIVKDASKTVIRKKRTQGERSAATRTKLKNAAMDLLGESGYAKLTVQKVASRAGVTTGAFMHHFASRTELFLALLAEDLLPLMDLPHLDPLTDYPLEKRCAIVVDRLWLAFGNPRYSIVWDIILGAQGEPEMMQKLEESRKIKWKVELADFQKAFLGLDLTDSQLTDLLVFLNNGLRGHSLLRLTGAEQRQFKNQLSIIKQSLALLIRSWKPDINS